MGVQLFVSYRQASHSVRKQMNLELQVAQEKIGTPMRFVEMPEFGQLMQEAALDPNKAPLLTGMLAYKDAAHGRPTQMVNASNEYTAQVLLRLGFRWSEPDSAYVNRMLTAISQLGFFDITQ